MSEIIEFVVPYLPEWVKEIDAIHAIRLVALIGGYIVFRNAASKYLANRQLKQQLAQDQDDKSKERLRELIEDPNVKSSGTDNGSWGWGKKTRRNVKRQEKILEEQLDNLHNGIDDDKDIEYLLED